MSNSQDLKSLSHTFLYSITIAIALVTWSCAESIPEPSSLPLKKTANSIPNFHKISADTSGIRFQNDIIENLETNENLFNFDYFYNGAGVGVEDLNNDGLLDIFFCGNQVSNQLYLNKGNLKFDDISKTAGINTGKTWANGITFVDINDDGYKDIYVSQGGPNSREQRKNLLYLNNKDLTFTESAEKYGLADMGITTQSAFFDYDKDGDLDCIVMNENELYGVDPINLYRIIGDDSETAYYNSSHLYRNDGDMFTDVTAQAGLLKPIFGLGLAVSDINDDGWLDIYIASDYYIPDALYLNNTGGTFIESVKTMTGHTSYFGMGLDIADINNDKLQDIFVLDMAASDHVRSKTLMASMSADRFDYLINKAGFHHQYMFNTFQLNMGNDTFNDIAQLTGTANTDWSWSVLLSDFDNDGLKDIFVTNGYRRYALDNDLQRSVFAARQRYGYKVPPEIKKKLYDAMPSEKLTNILYRNERNLQFTDVSKTSGIDDFSFSNGAAQGDFDNDGDLDLVVSNIDEEAFLYENTSSGNKNKNYLKVNTIGKNSEAFAKITISCAGKEQFLETKRVRGYMSAHENVAHFGLGNNEAVDSISVTWPSGKIEKRYDIAANSKLNFKEEDARPAKNVRQIKNNTYFQRRSPKSLNLDFAHHENFYDDFDIETLLPYKQSNFGPFISKGDVDGDGSIDVYIGGASGQAGQLYLQKGNVFRKMPSQIFQQDSGYEDMESVFFDFDGDDDLDLFVVSGGNEFPENSSYYADRLYLNDGKSHFTKHDIPALVSFPKSGKSVTTIDFDRDGDLDILVGNRIIPKKYPIPSPSVLYENKANTLTNVTSEKAPGLQNFGIINSLVTTDFDNDGWNDFIAVGEWTEIGFFKNSKGTFSNDSKVLKTFDEKGWWFSVHETDVNNDGLKDYVLGNVGLNLKFSASPEKPFKVFASDFDNNGINDIVLSKKYHNEYVPVRGRECSSQQMPFIEKKFKKYSDFANATMTDIYGEKLADSYSGEASEFKSILLLNKGKGQFEKRELPIQAQLFPIMDCAFYDINKDGYEDCILGGNVYETEVETTRLDAVSGLLLLSNGINGYNAVDPVRGGLYLKGNVKSLALLPVGQTEFLLTGVNNNALEINELKSTQ